jgi:predicted GH43/DUF377 family glycosyl hydrolase
MQVRINKMLLLVTVLVLSNVGLFAQVDWTKYPGNPIITGDSSGSWNTQLFLPFVLYNADSSRYEMWFSASDKSSGSYLLRPWKIGFAWSYDGINWTIYPTPVLNPSPGQWDSQTVEEACVIRENGQYKMWYSGGEDVDPPTPQAIGYATSPDGINWTKHSGPVLTNGSDTWERGGVCGSFIMPYESGYKMWYTAWNVAGSQEYIGYATSVDGITWQRDTQNNPVLSPGINGSWDDTWLGFPRVFCKDNYYYMYYVGVDAVWGKFQIGLAMSPNEVDWQKYPNNPILKTSPGQWDEADVELGNVLPIGDTLYMWYDGGGFSPASKPFKIGLAKSPYTSSLPPGTYTVGTGGYFPTIQEAFDKLETDGILGNVTLELIDELYTAPTDSFGYKLNGPIPGAGPNSRVTIQPAENKNVVIEGSGRFLITCLNTSYMTVDGVSISGVTTLTFHAKRNAEYTWNGSLDFVNNSDHNIVQNINFISDDSYGYGTGPAFETIQGSSETADSNLIQNNFIKRAGIAILVSGELSTERATGNIIRGNFVGSETDSLIGWGIQIEHCQNTIVENNIVQNLKVTHTKGEIVNMGINSWRGYNVIIRNNIVHGIKGNAGYMSVGILLSGAGGSNCQIYNNMVYDIQSSSTNPYSRVSGIQMFYQSNPKIYYNTVYLSGTGWNKLGSAALYIYAGVTNADIKNNILINMRDESQYCASAIYSATYGNLYSSDYNDLYFQPDQDNCLVRIGSTNYNTLAEWQTKDKDVNSVSEMPNFTGPYLHIAENELSLLESRGTPIPGITTDINGQPRHATTPDIGADEFTGIAVGVEEEETIPTEYALIQNYPNPFNPVTVIRYHLPVSSDVTLKIYDLLGSEIAVLIDENKSAGRYEVEFKAEDLPSGVYYYQLKAGEYAATKKMVLLK